MPYTPVGKKEGDKQSWAESMITAIIKNIQVTII